MHPRVAEHWKDALRAYEEAKTAHRDNEPTEKIEAKLYDATFHGFLAVNEYYGKDSGALVAAGDMFARQSLPPALDTAEAIERTHKILKKYRSLVRERDRLPEPKIDLE